MKIKNLLLLGLMTLFGMTAWAQPYYKDGGVVYNISTEGKAQVAGISSAYVGSDPSVGVTVTIPKQITDGESKTRDVDGFVPGWYGGNSLDGVNTTVDVTGTSTYKLTNLSVDITNIGILTGQVFGLTKLESLTITGHYVTNNYRLTSGLNTNMTELNLSGLKGYNKVLIESVDLQVKKITLPNQGQPVDIIAEAFKGGALEAIDLTGVAEVGASAFENCAALATVTIAPSVTTIGADAFKGTNVASLTINNANITEIPDGMFAGSYLATKLDITASELTTIGANAFGSYKGTTIDLSKCPKLKTVSNNTFNISTPYETIKLNNTDIDQANFEKIFDATSPWVHGSKTSLKTITLPAAITNIPEKAFMEFTALEGIDFTNTAVTEIKKQAFQGATALKGINLNNITKIGESAFAACNNVNFQSLVIPASVTSIGANAFKDMTQLKNVKFDNTSLQEIDAWFSGDTEIANIEISGAVTKIKASAFASAAGSNAKLTINAANLTEIAAKAFYALPIKTLSLTAANLATIGEEAFAAYASNTLDLSSLTSLATVAANSFPTNAYEKVILAGTALDDANFAKAQAWLASATGSLKEITLPAALTYIDGFAGFTKLEEIGLPSKVKEIKPNAFKGCSSLTGIKIKKNVTTIGVSAFEDCTSLAVVNFEENTALNTIGNMAFKNCALTSVAIPATLAEIGAEVFAYNGSLANVDFTNAAALTTIHENAFKEDVALKVINLTGAENLATVTTTSFPTNAYEKVILAGTALDQANFEKAQAWLASAKGSLATITLPEALTTIDGFDGFTALTEISLPNNVTKIEDEAFKGCTALTGIKIKKKVTSIGVSAFEGCTALKGVNFTDAIALTDIAGRAFYNTNLTSVAFPAALKTIGAFAFAFNGNLENIDFSAAAALETIGAEAFKDASSKLTTLDLDGATALTSVSNNAFPKNEYETVKTAGTKLAYTKEDGTYVDNFSGSTTGALAPFTKENILFASNKSLTTLTFPAGYKMEGYDDDLAYFENLTSISLPADLTEIPAEAFKGSNLTSYTVPATITKIGVSAFEDCAALETVDFSGATALETIDGRAFYKSGLTAVKIPASVKSIGAYAFAYEPELASVDFSEAAALETIGADAFKDCDKLTAVDFAGATALKSIGVSAFEGIEDLASVDFAGATALETIDGRAFYKTGLTTVKIPATVATIGTYAFAFNADLVSVDFSEAAALTTIDNNAFEGASADMKVIDLTGATKLETVKPTAFPQNEYTNVLLEGTALAGLADPDDETSYYDHFSGVAYFGTILANAQNSLEEITLPLGLNEIKDGEFASFAKLKEINLPAAVTRIGVSAFENSGLTGIKIKKNVKTIDASAFKDCKALAGVNMKEASALKTIGNSAFANCYAEDADGNAISGLKSIVIPANVTDIYQEAFAGCKLLATADFSQAAALELIGIKAFAQTALTSVDLSACAKLETMKTGAFPANEYTSVKLGGTILDDASFKNFDFSGATATLAELTLPETITVIPDNWFGETNFASDATDPETWMPFSALTSIVLPEGITLVGKNAFQGAALTEVTVGENVATIDAFAFEGCEDLATVDFSAATALTNIGRSAFQNTAIAEVAIPANADDSKHLAIGKAAFADNASLTSFTAESWAGGLADKLFQNCVSLPAIDIPATITSVGNYAFDGCESLATVTFNHAKKADHLDNIGDYAFRGCEALTALDLSKTKLEAIESDYPFEGCTALATITFPEELTSLDSDGLFADCPIENLEAPNLEVSGVLFGEYRKFDDEDPSIFLGYSDRDKDNANTTLKTVKIAGYIPGGCFAFCTALESVEWLGGKATAMSGPISPAPAPGLTTPAYVDRFAFVYCTALKTFTYMPENVIESLMVDDEAFLGCTPYILFGTNSNYLDYVATWHKGAAPVNATFGEVEITKVQTVQDKANATQFVAKYVNNGPQPVYIDANEAKVYSIYVDGDKAYFQACRTYDGKYIVQPQSWTGYATTRAGWNSHVIIVTNEAKEVAIHRMFLNELYEQLYRKTSIGHDDVYDSQVDDDLAFVQYNAMDIVGGVGQNYLYRLTNTSGVGFGFTAFTGTTIKEGQFFIACSRKPNGAGRLASVWLDEDGNVESETTGIESVESNGADNDAIYNMQGVRVEKAQKGIYIQNGKKIVVK